MFKDNPFRTFFVSFNEFVNVHIFSLPKANYF
jgi:hypothetical protein